MPISLLPLFTGSAPWFVEIRLHCSVFASLIRRIPWKFEIRQPHALIHDLIRPDARGRFKSFCAAARHIIVLLHSVPAYAQAAYEHAVTVQTSAPREEDNPALQSVGVGL